MSTIKEVYWGCTPFTRRVPRGTWLSSQYSIQHIEEGQSETSTFYYEMENFDIKTRDLLTHPPAPTPKEPQQWLFLQKL